jgi:hypothetical protein
MQRASKYLKSRLLDSISVCLSCMLSPLLLLHKGTGPKSLHQGGQDSMLPPLSHDFLFIVLVSFLDSSCVYDSFTTPWHLTHWQPLTHKL